GRECVTELARERGDELARGLLMDAHGAVTLDVAVTAYRAGAGSTASEVATQQQEVRHVLNRRDAVRLLGETHGPAANRGLGAAKQGGGGFDELAPDAALGDDIVPARGGEVGRELREALRLLRDEGAVDGACRDELLQDTLEEGDVAADENGKVQRRKA